MPRRIVSNSFVSGEISPELYGRHDLKAYFNGAARLENFIVRRTGGIRKRAGTDVLMTIDAEAAENAGTLDNRFKIYPYYFDADSFGILVFRINGNGVVQSRLSIYEDNAAETTEWANVPVPTGITATAEFDDLQCKQVGDTLFFTRMRFQSFACAITKASLSTEFFMIENIVTVPSPSAITATASGFETTSSHKTMVKEYALYGVKNGILSKPATIRANGTTPWFQGATITVRGTLDFSVHDYYILAKKTGMNFGKLSEIYPVEQIDAPSATLDSHDLVDEADGGVFSPEPAKFTNPVPDTLASSKSTLTLTPRAMFIKTTEYDDGGTTKYRCATPHFLLNLASPTQCVFSVHMRLYAVRTDTLAPANVDFASRTFTVTPFYYTADAASITVMAAQTINTTDKSTLIVDLGNLTGNIYVGLILESSNAYASDFIPVSGITIAQTKDVFNQASAYRYAVPEGLESDPNAGKTTCSITYYGASRESASYWLTTAWNAVEGLGIYATTPASWTDIWTQKLTDITLPISKDFHQHAFYGSDILFTMPVAQKQITALTIHVGAKILPRLTAGEYAQTPEYVTATLYAVDGATEVAIATFNINSGLISQQKQNINYGDVDATTQYRLVFSKAIVTRGITISSINTVLEFVDDNVIPSTITGQQDMLTVGDKNMDCATFDVHQQRSMFASSTDLPFTLWFSAVGDLQNFYVDRPQSDDNAFSVTIPAKRASKIGHVLASKDLMLFTEDGVYVVGGEGNVISYRTVQIMRVCDAAASTSVQPIGVDTKVLYVGEDGRTMFELAYNLMEDAITPTDRTVQAYHMTENASIAKVAYQRYPDGVVWCMLTDGSLIGMTYLPEHEVWAWHRHAFAAAEDGRTLADIMDIGSVVSGAGIETTSDILLVFTTATKTFIERMRPNICADVFADHGRALCADHAGDADPDNIIPVTATLVTLRPENPDVSTQGIPKRVVDVCLRLRRTGKVNIKAYDDSVADVEEQVSTENDDGDLVLFSGDHKLMAQSVFSPDGQMQIKSDDSLPCEITSIVFILDIPS